MSTAATAAAADPESGQYAGPVLDDLAEAVRLALPDWSLPATAEVTLLNISENATFRIDPPGSRDWVVLRVHRLGYHSDAEILSELAWLEALRRDGVVETPTALRGSDGGFLRSLVSPSGRPIRKAVAFRFIAGEKPRADGDLAGWFHCLGRITARLHRHSRDWIRPTGFERKTWDFAAMFGPQALWGPWQAAIGLDEPGRRLLTRALACIAARLERFGRAPERFGLIHADLRLDNLLVEGGELRLIDFDDCGFGWHLYDFAAAVSFVEDDPRLGEWMDSWVRGYRTEGALPTEDAEELPVFVCMRRFLLAAWLASHHEVPLAAELGARYTDGALAMAERLLTDFG